MAGERFIQTLGHPEVRLPGGSPVELRTKDVALLVFLCVEGERTHTRSRLAALLWGESPEDRARHSLTQAIYRIHLKLGRDVLRVSKESVRWLARIPCDAEVLLKGDPDHPLVNDALSIYAGPFVEGFDAGPGAEEFAEWADGRRPQLHKEALRLLEKRGRRAEEAGEWDRALRIGERAVQIDPMSEQGRRRVMRAYAARGEVNHALQYYQDFEKWLDEEIGAEPDRETRALAEQLRARAAEAPSAPVRAPAPPPVAEPRPETKPPLAAPPHGMGLGAGGEIRQQARADEPGREARGEAGPLGDRAADGAAERAGAGPDSAERSLGAMEGGGERGAEPGPPADPHAPEIGSGVPGDGVDEDGCPCTDCAGSSAGPLAPIPEGAKRLESAAPGTGVEDGARTQGARAGADGGAEADGEAARRRKRWSRMVIYIVLLCLAVLMGFGAFVVFAEGAGEGANAAGADTWGVPRGLGDFGGAEVRHGESVREGRDGPVYLAFNRRLYEYPDSTTLRRCVGAYTGRVREVERLPGWPREKLRSVRDHPWQGRANPVRARRPGRGLVYHVAVGCVLTPIPDPLTLHEVFGANARRRAVGEVDSVLRRAPAAPPADPYPVRPAGTLLRGTGDTLRWVVYHGGALTVDRPEVLETYCRTRAEAVQVTDAEFRYYRALAGLPPANPPCERARGRERAEIRTRPEESRAMQMRMHTLRRDEPVIDP